ncbi:sigma-54-dependent Fis family transcriptional regulator [Pleomorphomonas diazotrophica]|uniref:DNA-binding transcriptional regulator NtrC n=1 Tax=Pleomorphomonas diazotrophica TaxID=1166257 RepID=A0A1I4VU60_9HYPH|nr:sigma-54 dependent transcriptional regulator [Pleomorphomonas diazotrophica]PKR89301.1 sigma-54-dependent Fis family transcriptional regulator [Pleomorphomonas diazotrophica]SFN04547.1 DNA-binding transcriptional response regulator, NtrC family, contains REC, AAA-type ATPase, and a Fis-type DNA-binding domains [Pleomorphomonas diazotrophica]
MAARILIVDDDPIQRRLLEEAVKRFGHEAVTADGGEAGLATLAAARGDFQLMILDLVMPDLDGMAVLERLAKAGETLPVIVQTSRGSIDTVVGAMRAGAFDFIVKPVNHERLAVSIQNALKISALEGEIRRARRPAQSGLGFRDIITKSPEMARVLRLGERAATSGIPILIEGESGVGKELVARAIQGASDRRTKPFVTVNCGAIPENLVQSTLFGHEKGAFTGAVDRHTGKFQEAHTGTLFLDEVGELPLDVQVQLLRAIQEGEIEPVGARRSQKVDFRLISATNRRLLDMVKEGRFREDLYYRLNVYPIFVPPLRDRREDIPLLVEHFVSRFAAEEGKRRITGIRPDAVAMLSAFNWPGNIRQLENAVFRAVILCDGGELTVDEFPQIAAQTGHVSAIRRVEGNDAPPPAEPVIIESTLPPVATEDGLIGVAVSSGAGNDPAPFGFLRSLADDGHVRALVAIEEEMIRLAIDHYGGRMAEVARRLGIGRSTLYRKLKEYGLADGDDDDAGVAAE